MIAHGFADECISGEADSPLSSCGAKFTHRDRDARAHTQGSIPASDMIRVTGAGPAGHASVGQT